MSRRVAARENRKGKTKRESRIKGALSRVENTCPQCGQGAGLRELSIWQDFAGSAIYIPANALFKRGYSTSQGRKGGNMSKTKDNRKLIQFRAQPNTVRRIEQWYEADGCQSRNEFMERAVTYYTDALALMDSSLLPRAVTAAIDGRLNQFEDRLARLVYKTAVELDMQNGILADVCKLPEEEMRRRRAESVRNVKYTNGSISLEQRMRESDATLDDEDDEWQG